LDYLVFRGIKAERMRSAGFGEARPIATNDTPEGREQNRRVAFELVLE
jgi:outer membrane protein OmpA-like peptidoglycan-associated protein